VGVGRLVRGAVETDVGLDQHDVLRTDELADAAQSVDCRPHVEGGDGAVGDDNRWQRGGQVHAVVANEALGVTTEPPVAVIDQESSAGDRAGGDHEAATDQDPPTGDESFPW
jgi:hypothetical protein